MRFLRMLSAAALLISGLALLPAASAVAAPPSAAAPHPAVAAIGPDAVRTGVDDFSFRSLDVEYELGRRADGRSTLRTTEHFVALFPDFDQNRGIRRAIPTTYQGQPLQIGDIRVTDEEGRERGTETEFEDGFLELTIAVPEGEYVHGEQHYDISYTQQDVTRFFDQTADGRNADEFYWDVNGTGWNQPFESVTATVTLADGLADDLTGAARCYRGYDGSTDECDIAADGDTVTASTSDLGPRQNMTVAIGFEPGTFTAAPFELTAWVPAPALAGLGAGILALLAAIGLRLGPLRDRRGRGTVIAQYEPPRGMSALLAANLVGRPAKGMAATIVDLAVRRKVRILEREATGVFGGTPSFGLQRMTNIDDPDLLPAERAAFGSLFGAWSADVRWLTKGDTELGKRVVELRTATKKDAEQRGLRRKPPYWPGLVVLGLGMLGLLLCIVGAVSATTEAGIVIGVLGGIVASFVGVGAAITLFARRPLTAAGAEAVEHLEGLREFIRLAEADRLQMLQSFTGADRRAVGPVGGEAGLGPGVGPGVDVVHVYERLLPFAILFGLEKEWAAELAKYYPETSPDWYEGSNIGAFQFAAFASSISSFSSTVSTSYSGSDSSSSSGGSGGGGSSGGGGGGGGGGGV